MVAINKASKKLGAWRLTDCDLYVTLEPCPMCAGAIILSRIRKVYFGTMDLKAGSFGSILNMADYKFNHNVEIEKGIMAEECEYILKDFFKMLRNETRK